MFFANVNLAAPLRIRLLPSTVSVSQLCSCTDLITARSAVVGNWVEPPNSWFTVAKNASSVKLWILWVRMLLKGAVMSHKDSHTGTNMQDFRIGRRKILSYRNTYSRNLRLLIDGMFLKYYKPKIFVLDFFNINYVLISFISGFRKILLYFPLSVGR